MNVLGAVIAGVVGSAVFSMVLGVAPRMGMPRMDIVGLLGSMFGAPNRLLGWIMHLMMGMIFGLIYTFLWAQGVLAPTWLGGLVFGAVQWLVVGMIMGMMPLMHLGIRRGAVKAPGLWMTNTGGMLAFAGGLMGHLVFGIVVALVYALL
jgi:hypothetical protein